MDVNLRSYAKTRAAHARRNAPPRELVPTSTTERDASSSSWLREGSQPAAGPADLIVEDVRLVGDAAERPVSIAITGGVITFVGPPSGDEPERGPETRVISGRGATVLPGFTDSHAHLIIGAEQLSGCNVDDVRSKEKLASRVADFAAQHPDQKVVYVHGVHYLDPPLIDPDRARHELDEMEPDRPVFVYAHDLHTGWANTRALEVSGQLHPMPPFPRVIVELDMTDNIRRDEQGIPTGELKEPEAYFLVDAALRSQYPQTHEQKLESVRQACLALASYGITSIHNMGLTLPEEDIELVMLLLELEMAGRLPIRVHSSYSVVPDELMLKDVEAAAELRDMMLAARRGEIDADELHAYLMRKLEQAVDSQRWMRDPATGQAAGSTSNHGSHPHAVVRAIHLEPHLPGLEARLEQARAATMEPIGKVFMHATKLFMDGVVEQNTAFRSDAPAAEGIPAFNADELGQTVRLADQLGLPVRAHCIGDASVHMMLDAVASARTANAATDTKRGHRIRHRVEHIELCQPDDIPRFSKLETIPSMQPFHERPPAEPPSLWFQKVPETDWPTAFAWHSLLQTGAPLIFGSDWPIVSCDCLGAMRHAIDRQPWRPGMQGQGVTFPEAVAGFCSNPAYAVYEEQIAGRLEPGMLADLVVLSGSVGPDGAGLGEGTEVMVTISDGEVVFERERSRQTSD